MECVGYSYYLLMYLVVVLLCLGANSWALGSRPKERLRIWPFCSFVGWRRFSLGMSRSWPSFLTKSLICQSATAQTKSISIEPSSPLPTSDRKEIGEGHQ